MNRKTIGNLTIKPSFTFQPSDYVNLKIDQTGVHFNGKAIQDAGEIYTKLDYVLNHFQDKTAQLKLEADQLRQVLASTQAAALELMNASNKDESDAARNKLEELALLNRTEAGNNAR